MTALAAMIRGSLEPRFYYTPVLASARPEGIANSAYPSGRSRFGGSDGWFLVDLLLASLGGG